MIFRRSLVRELTATAIGLFLVLLAILFTNLVLRLLARAAGGTVAPEGILALLGFNALFYFNILLSVALFLTVLLTLSRWYRDSEMIVWFTSGQSLDRLAAADHAVCGAVPGRDRRAVAVTCRRGPSSASSNTSGSSSRATRSRCVTPGLFREFTRANLVVFVESINTFDGTMRNVFLHSVEDKQDATTVARTRQLEEMPNGDRFIVLEHGRRYEGKPGPAGIPRRRVRASSAAASSPPRCARCRRRRRPFRPTALMVADGRVERAELFWRISVPISRAGADAAGGAARVRQSAHGPLVQPGRGGVPVHALQQLPQHRAEPDRAGHARAVGGPAVAARDRAARRRACCSASSCR